MEQKFTPEELIKRYLEGTCTPEEKALVESWNLEEFKNSDEIPSIQEIHDTHAQMRNRIITHAQDSEDRPRRMWTKVAAAASIVVALSAGGYFLLKPQQLKEQVAINQPLRNDIAPGRNQATLTLANGQKIVLTANMSGHVATQGKTNISAGGGQLAYQANSQEDQVSYNSVSTAKGELLPFPLVLADGTKVWLNAESSLTFPTAFNGKDRIVKLTGEAYFEVKHNSAQPFRVETEKQTIEDIGTAFNVNAYTNEKATTTTLVEGSVRINNLTLKPGEQTDGSRIDKNVNLAQYTAWKNGDFDFEGNDIKTIMRQLARWYDIDVDYQGNINQDGFSATISRRKNISAILKVLEKTQGVHFKIEGRRIVVSQ